MAAKVPSLKSLVQGAHKNGATSATFKVTPAEAAEIRRAEAAGGEQAGLRVALDLLRSKSQFGRM
jgi:hypothetical protein